MVMKLKYIFFLLTAVLQVVFLFGQKQAVRSFILKGQLEHAASSPLLLVTEGDDGHRFDTIPIDGSGKFYFKTDKITAPMQVRLVQDKGLNTELYAAPGYDLTIAGDAKDYASFQLTKQVTGPGGQSNRYLKLQDSVQVVRKEAVSWYEMNDAQLLVYIKKDSDLKDSIRAAVFSRKNKQDPWLEHFGNVTAMDNRFLHLYYLAMHVVINSTFSYDQSVSFVRNNFDNSILDDICNEKYFVSSTYKTWLMASYAEYLSALECRRDSNYCKIQRDNEQIIKIIATGYKGRIREFMLARKIRNMVERNRSFEELNSSKEKIPAYTALLKNNRDRESIEKLLTETEQKLINIQTGKPAPLFTAHDSLGTAHSLSAYKGKVVYLDLWASWCGPCRAETPHFKKIAEKYKHDNRISFISVAVADLEDKWKEALREDQPDWLQLFDNDRQIQKAYVANSIPKFILISKEGNIVSFDAPVPSSGIELEKILDAEIVK